MLPTAVHASSTITTLADHCVQSYGNTHYLNYNCSIFVSELSIADIGAQYPLLVHGEQLHVNNIRNVFELEDKEGYTPSDLTGSQVLEYRNSVVFDSPFMSR